MSLGRYQGRGGDTGLVLSTRSSLLVGKTLLDAILYDVYLADRLQHLSATAARHRTGTRSSTVPEPPCISAGKVRDGMHHPFPPPSSCTAGTPPSSAGWLETGITWCLAYGLKLRAGGCECGQRGRLVSALPPIAHATCIYPCKGAAEQTRAGGPRPYWAYKRAQQNINGKKTHRHLPPAFASHAFTIHSHSRKHADSPFEI
jgi:hypothetical protein